MWTVSVPSRPNSALIYMHMYTCKEKQVSVSTSEFEHQIVFKLIKCSAVSLKAAYCMSTAGKRHPMKIPCIFLFFFFETTYLLSSSRMQSHLYGSYHINYSSCAILPLSFASLCKYNCTMIRSCNILYQTKGNALKAAHTLGNEAVLKCSSSV